MTSFEIRPLIAIPPLNIVLIVDHASVSGGQAKVAIESAIGLKSAGANPILFAAAGPVDGRLADAGVEVVCLGQTDLLGNRSRAAGLAQGTWNGLAARRLKDLLARMDPGRTIVHVHGWAKALSPSVTQPIRASGLRAVYTIHEYFLFCPTGGFYNYQTKQICALKPLSAACMATHCDSRTYPRKIWRSARLSFARAYLQMPEAFSDYISISAHQAAIIAPYLPHGARMHRLSNPIDAEDLGAKPAPASGDLVFVGRLSPEKGAHLFAEAALRAGATATFIGDGPLAEELKAAYPHARFKGWLAPEAVRREMRAARALVFPSPSYEGQPLTVLEAKAMGTPVIVSNVCAGRDEIEHGVSGLWFESANVGSLAGALNQMKDDRLVATLSLGAYASYWRAPPTRMAHVEGLLSIYGEMIGRAKAAA
jgi:glycosyltransferase involved in cell wall biosynthesis